MRYLNNSLLDCLELAENPLAFDLIYLHKYLQMFSYFISQDIEVPTHITIITFLFWLFFPRLLKHFLTPLLQVTFSISFIHESFLQL
jgi:hypothetical protein